MNFGFFECKFCNQRYLKEAQFKKHRCELMERDEYIRKTPRGRFAYNVYTTWIRIRKYQKQSRRIFIESRYYNSILKFAEFYYEYMLPDMEDYIRFVTKGQFLPQMWMNNDVYEQYISSYDDRVKPLKQAEVTFKYMGILANTIDCEIHEVFDYIYVDEMIKLIQCRRLSPWVLLLSKRFHRYMVELDAEFLPALESMVSEEIWSVRFKQYPDDYKTIRGLVKEFGI